MEMSASQFTIIAGQSAVPFQRKSKILRLCKSRNTTHTNTYKTDFYKFHLNFPLSLSKKLLSSLLGLGSNEEEDFNFSMSFFSSDVKFFGIQTFTATIIS